MSSSQHLPENATIQYDQITRVNMVPGRGWRFFYANGDSYVTESETDKARLIELTAEWDVISGQLWDVATKPATTVS